VKAGKAIGVIVVLVFAVLVLLCGAAFAHPGHGMGGAHGHVEAIGVLVGVIVAGVLVIGERRGGARKK
jgi:hypothetical protein